MHNSDHNNESLNKHEVCMYLDSCTPQAAIAGLMLVAGPPIAVVPYWWPQLLSPATVLLGYFSSG